MKTPAWIDAGLVSLVHRRAYFTKKGELNLAIALRADRIPPVRIL
jgi:hypothetical protein